MSGSPLDANEVEALMQAIQDGSVTAPESGEAQGPVVNYDLTSQDRIIRGQMPTLDSINDRIASLFGRSFSGRTRLDVRVTAQPATLLKFADVQELLQPPSTVGVLALGSGHGLSVLILEGDLAQQLLAGAMGDRKARAPSASEARAELTTVERMLLRHLLTLLAEAIGSAWSEVLPFRPEVLRFESDPRMATISSPSDVAILCPFHLAGTMNGKFQLVIPYAAVEPAKKLLTSPPRLGVGGDGDAKFSAALAREIEKVPVEVRVEVGRRTLRLADLLALKVGDLVTLSTSEGTPLPIRVGGRLKMTGHPSVVGGSLAAVVERPVGTSPEGGRPESPKRPGGLPFAA